MDQEETVSETASTGRTHVGAGTLASIELRDERERRLQAAKSEEEREAAVKDTATVQVVLAYGPEEAALVRKVLGHRPAERLLEL